METLNYPRDGIVWPLRAYPIEEAATFEQRYRDFQSTGVRVRGRETHIKPHLLSTWLDEIAHNETVLDAVESALGPDILLWESDFAIKEAGTGTWVPWHQDTPYWNLSTTEVVSVFVALTPVTKANGAMRVMLGTHVEGSLGRINFEGDPHVQYQNGQRTSSEGNIFFFDHIMNEPLDESHARDVELQPGEFSMHNIELLHGGGPNESDSDRIAFVARYISGRTRCRTPGRDSAMLMRGRCHSDHFDFEPRPEADFSPESLAALANAVQGPSGFGDRLISDKNVGDG